MKKIISFAFIIHICVCAFAQIPSGYYNAANGKSGATLKTALYGIINSHTTLSYTYLWTAFETTDKRSDGYVWDMYSSATNYRFGTDQAGSYSKEGDKYNREHSFPKSWFNDASPMVTDLMHIVPTDGFVNGKRSNWPLGETDNPTYKSKNDFSKLGPANSDLGYTGTVFEPADEYKGDFARIYFYMVTCYENVVSSWDCDMTSGNKYPALTTWAKNMLLRWAEEDPVSQKEINRNNAVYEEQGNRNPFVDFEGLEQYVWGVLSSTSVDLNNYTSPYGSSSTTLTAPYFSIASGSSVASGTSVTIACRTSGATIHYTTNGGTNWQTSNTSVSLTITETTTIQAYSTKGSETSSTASATYTISGGGNNSGTSSNLYQKVTSADQLVSGKNYVIFCPSKNMTMTSGALGSALGYVATTLTNDGYIDVSSLTDVAILTLGGSEGSWTLQMNGNNYLSWTSKNSLSTSTTATSDNQKWTITTGASSTTILNKADNTRSLQCNNTSGSERFACYTSSQASVQLYVQMESNTSSEITSVEDPVFSPAGGNMAKGSTFSITSATDGATIHYSISGGTEQTGTTPVTLTLSTPGNIEYTAYATYNNLTSEEVTASFEVQPSAPSLSSQSGTFEDALSVEISSIDNGVNIYYTLDGSDPTESSTPYSGTISLPLGTTTLKAITEIDGLVSEPTEQTYTIVPSAPVFSLSTGTYNSGTSVSITASLPGATIYYTTDGTDPSTSSSQYESAITLTSTTTLKAIAVKDTVSSSITEATYTIRSGNLTSTGIYTKVSSADDLEVDANYIIVCQSESKALGAYIPNNSKPYFGSVDVTISNDSINLNNVENMPTILTLGGEANAYTFGFQDNEQTVYLSCPSDNNYLSENSSATDTKSLWTVTIGETTTIQNNSLTARYINYNSGSPRFASYKTSSNQKAVTLFKEVLIENTSSTTTVLIGDVNNDNVVDITDITSLVNYILGINNETISDNAADIDNDKSISVNDIVDLVNRIINGNTSETREVTNN